MTALYKLQRNAMHIKEKGVLALMTKMIGAKSSMKIRHILETTFVRGLFSANKFHSFSNFFIIMRAQDFKEIFPFQSSFQTSRREEIHLLIVKISSRDIEYVGLEKWKLRDVEQLEILPRNSCLYLSRFASSKTNENS